MTGDEATKPAGKGPLFYAGMMFSAYGVIAALTFTGAIEGVTVLLLMIAPLGMIVPMVIAANKRADARQSGGICAMRGAAQRRYIKRVAIATSAYLASFALMTFTIAGGGPSVELRAFLAILPGLSIVGMFWAFARLIIEEQDEFMRMLTIRQSLIGTGFALCAATIWGFLESADVVIHVDAYWWAIVWFFGIGVGAVANRIQYGTWGAV